ncbi:MAG: glycosyltransferase [Gemmatimonadaceae bacterium]|nr:glycosyltransferase [Gemmatimonadaceae bacterium]
MQYSDNTGTRPAESSVGTGGHSPIVLIPVYNDWNSLRLLLRQLDSELTGHGASADVLVVNDGSTSVPTTWLDFVPHAIGRIEILTLWRNLGHQRALSIGLCHLATLDLERTVVVMDGDGEDRASDVLPLVHASTEHGHIAFAKRMRRSEGMVFSLFYYQFRIVHRLLVGFPVEVGNFSAIPFPILKRLVVVSELWNHYAAAVVRARLPRVLVPTARGTRLAGRSHMDFLALVSHGLSAMSVFADRIGVRLLAATGFLMLLLLAGIGATVGVKFFTSLAIPGWATVATGVLFILLSQAALLSLVFVFMIQFARASMTRLPIRDFDAYVESLTCVYSRDG